MLLKYAEGGKLEPGYLDSTVMCEADKVGRIIQNMGDLSSSALTGFAVLCPPLGTDRLQPVSGHLRERACLSKLILCAGNKGKMMYVMTPRVFHPPLTVGEE